MKLPAKSGPYYAETNDPATPAITGSTLFGKGDVAVTVSATVTTASSG
jgi:hypothetical protein